MFSSIAFLINNFFQKHALLCLGVFVGFAIAVAVITAPLLQKPQLRVVFLNVGQGDAIWIQAPNGRELLIDAGPDQSVLTELGKEKTFFDRSIDMILATHSDKDHIGGFSYVLDRYNISTVIESEISSPTLTDKTFNQKVIDEHSTKLTARTGERIILDQKHGVVLDILFPDQNPTNWETNEASIVAKLSYGSTSFLLNGDSPSEVEDHLVQIYGDQLHVDVLKLGHHGSKTSSSDEFLGVVSPTMVIASAGAGNKYGHPTGEVLERAEIVNAQVLRTDEMGSIDCRSDGKQVSCFGEH